jgi:hypothetical protein
MHPFISETIVRANQRELDRVTRGVHGRPQVPGIRQPVKEPVVLRLATVRDAEAISRLALLDGRPEPDSRCVVAEVEGTIMAALPLGGGKVVADPFRPTAHLIPLLELRAEQLSAPTSKRRRALQRLLRAA